MTTTYKVLGQSAPSATTDTTLYTVPSATQAVCSTLTICNRANTSATFRWAVRPAGAALANQHYQAYDVVIAGADSIHLTLGVTLGATDVVTVYASTANLSFSLYGSEIS
jgi:hypothetical protein